MYDTTGNGRVALLFNFRASEKRCGREQETDSIHTGMGFNDKNTTLESYSGTEDSNEWSRGEDVLYSVSGAHAVAAGDLRGGAA